MRKLAIASGFYSATVFLINYLLPDRYIWQSVICAAVLSIAVYIYYKIKKIPGILLIAAISILIGSFSCCVSYYCKKQPSDSLDGQERSITGVVLSYPNIYEDYSRIDMSVKVDGITVDAIVYDDESGIDGLVPGDYVRFSAKMSSAGFRYGQEYDIYNSKDIFLICNVKSAPENLGRRLNLRAISSRISHEMGKLISQLFPDDVSPFMKSLLIGDKTDFYKDNRHYIDLNRAGLSHIIAVSGMHVAFLVSVFQLLFGHGRKNSLFCIILIWLFILISGGSPSAVRAGIMQSLLLMAPVFDREFDSITSLSFALALILFFNPYSCTSISLQLSFGAMTGLTLFSSKINAALSIFRADSFLSKAFKPVIGIISASLSVLVFTLPLTAIYFGTISLLSPLSNILALWSVSFCFILGFVAIAIGAIFHPLGVLVATVSSLFARYIFAVSHIVSSYKYAVVYFEDILIKIWLIFSYCIIFLSFLSQGNTAKRLVISCVISAASLTGFLELTQYSYSTGCYMGAVDVGQGQCLFTLSENSTIIIDCGTLNYGLGNAGDKANSFLRSRGRTEVEYLLLTHLHSDHTNGAVRLMYSLKVDNLVIPTFVPDDDNVLPELLSAAEINGVNIISIDNDTSFADGDINIRIIAPGDYSNTNEGCMMVIVSKDDYDMIVTGDAPKSSERQLINEKLIPQIDLLIAGHHGSRYSSSGEFLSGINADKAIISVGYNTYGHPTFETLERLAAYGYTIYRTDLNGTIEFKVA